jgi:GNAT superfamily N-acetyltransferase
MTADRTVIAEDRAVHSAEAVSLYGSVGWSAYTDAPGVLAAGLAGSDLVLTARVEGRLVGLARTVTDGATICFVQDLLVHPDFRRRGVGRSLMRELLDRHHRCRQFVLITDADAPDVHAFYRSLGLVAGEECRTTVFQRL